MKHETSDQRKVRRLYALSLQGKRVMFWSNVKQSRVYGVVSSVFYSGMVLVTLEDGHIVDKDPYSLTLGE